MAIKSTPGTEIAASGGMEAFRNAPTAGAADNLHAGNDIKTRPRQGVGFFAIEMGSSRAVGIMDAGTSAPELGRVLDANPLAIIPRAAPMAQMPSIDADAPLDADGPYDAGFSYTTKLPTGGSTSKVRPKIGV